jgi:hypothetical protein
MIEVFLLIFGIFLGFGITISATFFANKHTKKIYESVYFVEKVEENVPENDTIEDTEQAYNWDTYDDHMNKFGLPDDDEELESYDKDRN